MGGTPALIPRLPIEVAEDTYASVLEKLGITDDSPAERVRKLKETDRADWVTKLGPGLALSPVADKDENKAPFYQAGVPEEDITPPGWCPRIMLGDCEMDVSLTFGRVTLIFLLFLNVATDEELVINSGLHPRPPRGRHRGEVPHRPRPVPGRQP